MAFFNVGAMFKNTSKKGNDYFSFQLFKSNNSDANVTFFANEQVSKKGTKYWSISMAFDGTLNEALRALIEEMKRHAVANKDKGEKTEDKKDEKKEEFDNSEMVEEEIGF